MASRWFYRVFDQEMGPVGFQDLAELVRAGTLTEEDPVRREFSEDWIAARAVIGLFRAAQGPAVEAEPAEAPGAPGQREAVRESPQIISATAVGEQHSSPNEAASPGTEPRRRRRLPRMGVTAGVIAAIVLVVAAIVGYEMWSHRRSRVFPESAMSRRRPADSQSLESILGQRPKTPSIPGLELRKPTPIPGLESIDPGFSPWLAPDLKTIVVDRDNALWIGTDRGIAIVLDPDRPTRSGAIAAYRPLNGLTINGFGFSETIANTSVAIGGPLDTLNITQPAALGGGNPAGEVITVTMPSQRMQVD